ncbi:MAG TPA: hypothetical protein VMT24_12690 [Aggregatilineaceae bacterium]|nr:hypothetical protein [Aggregatilineaceae bacterium]
MTHFLGTLLARHNAAPQGQTAGLATVQPRRVSRFEPEPPVGLAAQYGHPSEWVESEEAGPAVWHESSEPGSTSNPARAGFSASLPVPPAREHGDSARWSSVENPKNRNRTGSSPIEAADRVPTRDPSRRQTFPMNERPAGRLSPPALTGADHAPIVPARASTDPTARAAASEGGKLHGGRSHPEAEDTGGALAPGRLMPKPIRDTEEPESPQSRSRARAVLQPVAPDLQPTGQPAIDVGPVVYVSIGRIEVRAAVTQKPVQPSAPAPAPMSLDDYLDPRSKRGAR